MTNNERVKTDQEEFWQGAFGDAYIDRNRDPRLLASNVSFFNSSLRRAGRVEACVELGANIGMNLRALQILYPDIDLHAVEINARAAAELSGVIGETNVAHASLFDWKPSRSFDLVVTKGVLIHLDPDMLPRVYESMHSASERFILIAEYYNPAPVEITYRGHSDRLYKRDFAGDVLDRFSDLRLVDYGFKYHRDPAFPQDDITWFLLEKVAR